MGTAVGVSVGSVASVGRASVAGAGGVAVKTAAVGDCGEQAIKRKNQDERRIPGVRRENMDGILIEIRFKGISGIEINAVSILTEKPPARFLARGFSARCGLPVMVHLRANEAVVYLVHLCHGHLGEPGQVSRREILLHL